MKKLLMVLIFILVPLAGYAQPIKPGVTITKENYREYISELKKMLDPGTYIYALDGLKRGLITMPVVKRKVYPQSKLYYKYTMKYAGTCKVGSNNQLIGWKAGQPFPDPKSAAELAWNLDRRQTLSDQNFMDGHIHLYGDGKRERTYRWFYYNFYYNGRVRVPPIHEIPGNNGTIRLKTSFLIKKPYDVKGFCFIRIRYEDVFKADDVYSYIPAIRRMRRLTGADVCDPMLGSDVIYDDFELSSQKVTPKMTFKMSEREMLVPSHVLGDRIPQVNHCFQVDWEIRPVRVLEIYPNDPEYIYSKRVLFLEKQRMVGLGHALNTYDQRGRFCRSQFFIPHVEPAPYYDAYGAFTRYDNVINTHFTQLEGYFKVPDLAINQDNFSFKWLLRKSR